ncbi:MAG TPA: AAA family ATPase, partial [Bacteroidetes bacterium]|nr:AAA family ATPase [Bacteroidota bacterium]
MKEARMNFISQYQNFIAQHKGHSYFNFDFLEGEKIKNYSMIHRNLESYQEIVKELLSAFSAFQDFFEWKSFFLSLARNQRTLLIALIKSNATNWECALESWYYDCVLSKYENELGPFHQNNRLIKELSSLNQSLKQMQRNKIADLWAKRQLTSIKKFKSQTGNINSLYNYKKNKQYGRKNSLRKIIHTDFDLFTDFFPVVMVNPVVSSSILPLKEGLFDIIIFDEASQLRLEDTYTAYIRGKYKIISGDVHQMPPSNYFGKEIVLDIEEDDEDLEKDTNGMLDDSLEMADKESLLQFGVDSGFDKSYLDFHYRSRHPYLIDFSNAAFYGSRLTPMPEKYAYKPIRFLQVNGLYEKNRTNPAEAKSVIDILFNHIHPKENGDYPSIGIATFNIDQRNLILEMIQDECYLEEEKNRKHEKLRESGLFVKNLENIQGDERDIIIISTTFGLNSEGKFRQNFGPINQLKGYKLLNVIITRAKHRLYLCTSIP